MTKRFTELYLCSFAILIMGLVETISNYAEANAAEGLYSDYFMLFVGAGLLVYAITSHVKYNANKKQLEREMSKEYDERDDLVEGKASHFTMRILMVVTFLMMFLSKWVAIPTNTALFAIVILCMITNLAAKKFYYHFL